MQFIKKKFLLITQLITLLIFSVSAFAIDSEGISQKFSLKSNSEIKNELKEEVKKEPRPKERRARILAKIHKSSDLSAKSSNAEYLTSPSDTSEKKELSINK